MPDNMKAGELNQGDIFLKPSASDGYSVVGSWVLSIIFVWALLERISPSEWYYHIAHIIGAGAMGFLAYRTWIAINNLRTGKIFLKLTSSGINYRNVKKTYAIAWSDISEFLIEHDANEFFTNGPPRTEKRFYLVTKGNSDKICIDIRFGYDEIGLAELMAAKMRQSLNLSLDRELVYVERMVYGNSIEKHGLGEIYTANR